MVQLTGWNQDTLEAIKEVKIFRPCFEKQDPVGSLIKIKPLMDIAGINVKVLLKLKDLYNLKVSGNDEWKKYTDVARDLELITEEDEGYLAREKRDILARYMIHINQDLKNMRDLYGFLLIDVEMSECSKISPIKAALNSVQLYIHRAMMKIEEGVEVDKDLTEEKWKWLSSYREWEASNKIKLYLENYLNPTLRKVITPEYKKLQNTLMQGNITDEGVSDAYMKYFEDFEQVTSLKIVDSCFERVEGKNTLYVIGRTLAQPYDYYYRTAIFDEENQNILYWTAWEKIEASIPVETVTPIYAFNRLFIFWVQQIEKGKDNEKRVDATINYIFQKPSGSWTAPQKLASDIKVEPVEKAKKLYWKKIAAFYLKEQGGSEKRIVIVIGETKFDSQTSSNLFTLDEDLVANKSPQGMFINNFTYETCTVDLKKKFDPLPFSSKAVIGNKVIFFGGKIDDDQYSSQVNIYDNETREWSTHTASEGRIFVPVAVVGKKPIFFGGDKGNGQSAQIDIYDDETKGWTSCLMKGRPGYRSDVAIVGKKAIFFCDSGSPQIDIYDDEAIGEKWTTHTASEARHNPAIAVVGKKAIFFGGEKFYNLSPKVDIYDAETGRWAPHITSEARKEAAVVVSARRLFSLGVWGNVDILHR
nr:neuraminidase-like domain-containing protein [Rickettsia endosymbiont of Ceutorhynchus assimilis]